MKQLSQEALGPMLCFGTATLYVYDGSDEESMTAVLDFLHEKEVTKRKFDYRSDKRSMNLDVSESEPAALLIGSLNEKWAPLVREEVERESNQ